ncbi:MAG: formylglycine-generating enzyme family protein [Treponema sp.]|jgi:formylglycine-generating enzyme required for sulfatase activity|nr:formylglycine-generating enzyme family protein [Treponema sp.]
MSTRKITSALAVAALVALAFTACPSPSGGGSKPVTIAAIPGAIKPITGRPPATAVGATEQYTGAVSWLPLVMGTFAEYESYTATITLTANPGYTFAGVAADFFTVAGASASNDRNSSVVTAAFPATGGPPVPVTIAAIPGVTAPLTYETPVAAIAGTAQYTGTVAWSPAAPVAFAGETAYTATITLAAEEGYTFDGVAADFFTVAGATSVGNAANSGVVTAAFPQTERSFIEMVPISGGTFTMGSPAGEPNRYSGETQHEVTLGGFWMGKYQVTQEQYEEVMGANPSYFTTANGRPPAAGETDARRPVESVSWYDALVFCNKVSVLEGLTPAYSISGSTDPAAWGSVPTGSNSTWNAVQVVSGSTGYRLPTEAQWEYACRAGTTTAYNTGASISDDTGWYSSNSGSKTHEVGKKPANAWGLHDMHGNVYEWCWDRYGAYPGDGETDPLGAVSGGLRVIRGGSWGSSGQYLRSAYRYYYSIYIPYRWYGYFGFRLVRP